MIVRCAWCLIDLGQKEPLDDQTVSHGICPDCSATLLASSTAVAHQGRDSRPILQPSPTHTPMSTPASTPMHYQIIQNELVLNTFLDSLPALHDYEVWYACLFGRHKYDRTFPNTKDSGQLSRFVARDKRELKEKLRRLESPLGSFSRDGIVASQACLSVYISVNPRSLIKANKLLLVELAERFSDGQTLFNPISLSTTAIHRAVERKFWVDFDYDGVTEADLLPAVRAILPDGAMYRVLRTHGGFHVLVCLEKIRGLKAQWHQALSKLPGCDVRGSDTLMPVPGCTQGGSSPYFI